MEELIKHDIRSDMFCKSIRFIDYEIIDGDIIEFGVYTGKSLCLLSNYHRNFKNGLHGSNTPERNIIGIDSFEGLPENDHCRWTTEKNFKNNHSWHPFLSIGSSITVDDIYKLFNFYKMDTPIIINDLFKNSKEKLDKICNKVALIHIDCDLYESTLDALELVKDKIQNGTIILFDDWFNYKADENKGEQKAFKEFLIKNPNIKAIQYQMYGTFCNSFILKV